MTAPHWRHAVWPPVPSGRAANGGQCTHSAPDGCRVCSGDARDEWAVERAARDAAVAREKAMRTDPGFRLAWLGTFSEPLRAAMAAHADRTYGPMPALTEEVA